MLAICGLRRGHIRRGLVERNAEVAVVDPGQHLAGRDPFIILDQHLEQIAGDLRRDGGAVGLHIGIVGRHQILADGPIVPAIPGRARQRGERRTGQQQLAQIEFFAASTGVTAAAGAGSSASMAAAAGATG